MDRDELVRAIAEKKHTTLTLIQIDQIIRDAIDIMSDRLAKKETIYLAGFGSFALSDVSVKPIGKYVSSRRKPNTRSQKAKR